MLIHELTEEECRVVLKQSGFGRVACARDGQPYVVPIYFYIDGDYLYSFATLGQKIEWMRENPKVCVEVDEFQAPSRWMTVVVFGRYEELRAPEDAEALRKAEALFAQRAEWWQPAAAKSEVVEHHVPIPYRIRITRITGRRAARDR